MKDRIDKYGFGEIDQLVKKLSPKNKKLLEKAIILFQSTAGKSKSAEHKRAWIKLAYTFDKNMDNLKQDDCLTMANLIKNSKLSNPAKNELRNVLKRWIRDSGFYLNWNIEFNTLLRKNGALKCESEVNTEKIKQGLASDSEVKILIQSTPDLMWKTLIQLNSLLACRTGCELLPRKFKDIDFDKQTIKILSNKTGRLRVIYIGEAMKMVKRWFEEYKYPNVTKEDYVFPSPRDRYKPLNLQNYELFIRKLSLKVLGRAIKPYGLRHSTLKERQKKLSPMVYTQFADHSLNVANKFYNQMTEEDITKELKERVFEIKEITPEQKDKLAELEKQIQEERNKRLDFEKRLELLMKMIKVKK